MVINTQGKGRGGASEPGRAVVSSRVVGSVLLPKRVLKERFHSLTHPSCLLLCVGHAARHGGGCPGNIFILSFAFFYKEKNIVFLGCM